jgi:thiamine biosynthesis lipoprotein
MGTLISVTCEEENGIDAVFDEFAHLDNLLSTYKETSEISTLNRLNTLIPSPQTREIVQRSLEMNTVSRGAFDVTIGSLTHSAYRFGYDNEHLPSPDELSANVRFVGSNNITLHDNTIKTTKGTIIDLGGIGKGYAVDKSIELLEKRGIKKAIIAASGDIGCLGACEISLQDPFRPDGSIAKISSRLTRFAISTSGNYNLFIKTKANNHLINPKTHKPQQWFASVTLFDDGDNTRLDALATAVSVMEEKEAIKMVEELKIGYVLIRNDGTRLTSSMPKGITLFYF